VRINRSVAIGAVTAMLAIALPLLTLPASAASGPPWEPDPQALGTLSFFNAAGQQIFGGSSLTHLFDYAEASSADTTGGTKATMTFGAPAPGVPTGTWFTAVGSGATNFPNSAAPSPLNTSPNPVVSLGATDGNLTNFIAQVPAQTQTGYADVFQIRVSTSGLPGTGTGTSAYWDADVTVNTTAGTWTEVYPQTGATAIGTTTTLAASPLTSAQQNASVTLTATVTAADTTHPAGTVQFLQDGFNVGSPVAVSTTDGTAALTTTALLPSAPGGTALTAAFTPTDSSSYSGSTSSPLNYTVDPVANVPTIAGPHQAGQKETCTDGKLDFGVNPSYTWLANGASIGTGASLTVPGSAYKKTLACQATVQDGTGPVSAPATSTTVTVILGKALTPSKKPTLSGTHKVGKVETAHAGTWPRGATFTYQWLLNGKVIKRATKSTLKLTSSELGKKISCRVTAHLTGFANGSSTTASVKVS
jgi:hypothetical protein